MNDILPAQDTPDTAVAPTALLDALLAPATDPLFWRPTRLNVDSAWYGHIPFAHWIVAACRPRSFVELGSHAGVSYSAFCEAVLRARLATRCIAVDTWQGDDHAGFYGEDIYRDLLRFHDSRYGAFSQLLRCTFNEALAYMPDGSVDLLHIDGRHSYEDVSHDYANWLPKLSDRAVVLFHDTNARERGFGVWRLWAELSATLPHFEFLHEHGLGVLAVGADAPASVAALCRLRDAGAAGRVRERFAQLGERWMIDIVQQRVQREAADLRAHNAQLERDFHIIEAYSRALGGGGHPPSPDTAAGRTREARLATARAVTLEAELQLAHRRLGEVEAALSAIGLAAVREQEQANAARKLTEMAALVDATQTHADNMDAQAAALAAEVARLRAQVVTLDKPAAIGWHLRRAARGAARRLTMAMRRPAPPVPLPSPAPAPAPAPATPPPPSVELPPSVPAEPVARPVSSPWLHPRHPATGRTPRVIFASGEPGTPGEQYRCVRYAEAARDAGWTAMAKWVELVTGEDLAGVDLLILWRTHLTPQIERLTEAVHLHGGRVALDLDDLMHKPELARIDIIDGIRTIHASEGGTRGKFAAVQQVQMLADFCIATTIELADQMRGWLRAAYVLPNGYDEATHRVARRAARLRQVTPADDLVRIGYASGSRTHQKDFAVIVPPISAVLRARPNARLVLFRSGADGFGLVMPEEFPGLDDVLEQIEWRELVPLAELPGELARFDINLVPLEVGNPFVEAKSELKYFEAALAGVCTIASPTGPYRRAIADGRTGFLAHDAAEWEARLLTLIDDPALRARLARDAYLDVIWRFGPSARAETMRHFLAQHRMEATASLAAEAARAFAGELARPKPALDLPELRPTETLFRHDAMGDAEVTVVIPVFNYAEFILEALESARIQTLERIDLVVVDDCSTDPATAELVLDWVQTHAARFNRVVVLRHLANAGLGAARNAGFTAAETRYVLPLDADNRLRPEAAARLLAAIEGSGAAFAYPQLQKFGVQHDVFGGHRFEPQMLAGGNSIDAMALVAKAAWAAAGGYYVQRDAMGWEDYDIWCRFAELGLFGLPVPEILAEYRVHRESMVDAFMETAGTKAKMVALVESRHPWLRIISRVALQRQVAPAVAPAAAPSVE